MLRLIKKFLLLLSICLSPIAYGFIITTGPLSISNIEVDNNLEDFRDHDTIAISGTRAIQKLVTTNNHIIAAINLQGNAAQLNAYNSIFLGSTHTNNLGFSSTLHLLYFNPNINVNLTGTAGEAGTVPANNYQSLKLVDFNNQNSSLTISSPNTDFSNTIFQSTGGNNGNIIISAPGITFANDFNSANGNKVKTITIGTNGSTIFNTDVNLSEDLIVSDNSSMLLKANHIINSNNLKLLGGANNSTIILEHNAILNTPVTSNGSSAGKLEFLGATQINHNIDLTSNKVTEVSFSSNNPAHISAIASNIYGSKITSYNSQLNIAEPVVEFGGNYQANNTHYILGTNTLKFSKDAAALNGNLVFDITYNGTIGGHLSAQGINLNMSNANSIIINLTDTSAPPTPPGRQFTVFAELLQQAGINGSINLPSNQIVTLNQPSHLVVKWVYDNGVLYQTILPTDQVQQIIINNLQNPANTTQVSVLLNSPAGQELMAAANQNSADSFINALQPTTIALGAEASSLVAENSNAIINNNMQLLKTRLSKVQNSNLSGVAAGDENKRYGVWASPYIGYMNQQNRLHKPGYKTKYFGGLIGVDTKINEEKSLGAALNFSKNHIKHTAENAGDVTKIRAFNVSLYALQEWRRYFFQTIGSFGLNYIDNCEKRYTLPDISCAKAKYRALNYSFEVSGGYKYKLSDRFGVSPIIGIEYSRLAKIKYTETGAGAQNLIVRRKFYHKLEAIVGGGIRYVYPRSNFLLVTELGAVWRRELLRDKFKINSKFASDQRSVTVGKTAEQNYNNYLLSLSTTIQKDDFEYGFNYSYRKAKGFYANQFMLKLRKQI